MPVTLCGVIIKVQRSLISDWMLLARGQIYPNCPLSHQTKKLLHSLGGGVALGEDCE